MTEFDYMLFIGLILTGACVASPIAYALGRRDERQLYLPVWRHVRELHDSLNHKSYLILTPRVGEQTIAKRRKQ